MHSKARDGKVFLKVTSVTHCKHSPLPTGRRWSLRSSAELRAPSLVAAAISPLLSEATSASLFVERPALDSERRTTARGGMVEWTREGLVWFGGSKKSDIHGDFLEC